MANHQRSKQIRRTVPGRIFDRRTFLRGSIGGVGVCVALPLLDIMLNDSATALAGGGAMPRRFGVFYWGGGIVHSTWVPEQTGFGWAMPDSLQPFENLRDYVTLVTGTNHEYDGPPHIPARGIALSSSHDTDISEADGNGPFRGQNHPEPSIDNIVSEAWQGQTPFSSVEVGICRAGPYKSNTSWKRGGTSYNRHEADPVALFNRLFSNGVETPNTDVLGASAALNKSMLDAVMDDTSNLLSRLGSSDRIRMEQHLEGLRAIERRLEAGVDLSCGVPPAPPNVDYRDNSSREEKSAKAEVMTNLLATALACDLTRVFSYEWSAGQSQAVYWELGISLEAHEYNHQNPADSGMQQMTRFIMSHYADFAEALRQRPEGAGNVLDNTLIFGTSEHASAGNHTFDDHPFLLLGKASGALQGGLHYRHPNPNNNYDAPKVLLTAVRAMGIDLPRLGQEGGVNNAAHRVVTDSISEILL